MSTGEPDSNLATQDPELATAEGDQSADVEPKLNLRIQITDTGPCKKHVHVTIPREDIDRQYDESLGSVRKEVALPGFRPGRAPSKLVQRRMKKEVESQVKSTLLYKSLKQMDDEKQIKPISPPDLDLEAIEIPDSGDMIFEMDLEVSPDFPMPEYKKIKVNRPTGQVTPADVDRQFQVFLERYAREVPKTEGHAELGDIITANVTFSLDGQVTNLAKELRFRLQPELRFQDGQVPRLGEDLAGAKIGDVRGTQAIVGSSSLDPRLRNKTLEAAFEILDLKTLLLPEVDRDFLKKIGYDSVTQLRDDLFTALERRLEFQQQDAMRREVLNKLLGSVDFHLPADLVARQEKDQIRRSIQKLRQSGLDDNRIRAREAEIRANAHEATERTLKEYFLLGRIAEEEKIDVEDSELEMEILRIADASEENPRRVRARLDREGQIDVLKDQILERKTLDYILQAVEFEDVPLEREREVETVDQSATMAAPESQQEDVDQDA